MQQSTTKLVFPTLHLLWEFAKEINVHSVEIIVSKKMLVCECKDEDVRLAETKYGARQLSVFRRE
jgi:hypothetical protein